MKILRSVLIIATAIFGYLFAYNTFNITEDSISAISLPKEDVNIKVYGEKNNGTINLYRIKTDNKKEIVQVTNNIIKYKQRKVMKPTKYITKVATEKVPQVMYIFPVINQLGDSINISKFIEESFAKVTTACQQYE